MSGWRLDLAKPGRKHMTSGSSKEHLWERGTCTSWCIADAGITECFAGNCACCCLLTTLGKALAVSVLLLSWWAQRLCTCSVQSLTGVWGGGRGRKQCLCSHWCLEGDFVLVKMKLKMIYPYKSSNTSMGEEAMGSLGFLFPACNTAISGNGNSV